MIGPNDVVFIVDVVLGRRNRNWGAGINQLKFPVIIVIVMWEVWGSSRDNGRWRDVSEHGDGNRWSG